MWTDRGYSSALTCVPSGRRISTTLGQRRNVPKRLGLGDGSALALGSSEIQRGERSNSTPAGQFGDAGLRVPVSCTVMSQRIVIDISPMSSISHPFFSKESGHGTSLLLSLKYASNGSGSGSLRSPTVPCSWMWNRLALCGPFIPSLRKAYQVFLLLCW